MDYKTDILPYIELGDEEYVASVISCITSKVVPMAELENFMSDEGLAERNPINGKWEGILPNIALSEDHPLKEGIIKLFSHINKPRSIQIDTIGLPWCLYASNLLNGLVQMGIITEDHRSGFYQLGGGLKYGTVTVEQILQLKEEYENDQLRIKAKDSVINKINKVNSAINNAYDNKNSPEEIIEAAEAAWADE